MIFKLECINQKCVHENFVLVDNQFGNKKDRYRNRRFLDPDVFQLIPAVILLNQVILDVLTILAPPSYEECVFGAPVRPVKLPEHAQRGAEREEPEDNHFDDIDGYVPTYPFYPRYDLFL